MANENCAICYNNINSNWFVRDVCENGNNCVACLICVKNNISNQFGDRVTEFKCICNPQNFLKEEKLEEYLGE